MVGGTCKIYSNNSPLEDSRIRNAMYKGRRAVSYSMRETLNIIIASTSEVVLRKVEKKE